MTFPEAVRYLESFVNYEKKSSYHYKHSFELGRVKEFLGFLDNPQNYLNCIHVAGTKGKGSTCAFIAYILRQSGYKVGLYTSPHLSDFRERIRILTPNPEPRTPNPEFEGMITKKELAGLAERLKPVIDKFNKNSKHGPLTFFEVYTALAFIYFKEKKADFVVLETGLGGRLDATNVVSSLACVITPISLEHTQLLGNTIAKIAREKVGIIKNQKSKIKNQSLIVISAPQEKEAALIIRNRCRQVGARLYEAGKDIIYKIKNQKSKIKNKYKIQKFDMRGILSQCKNLEIKLKGGHQLMNAAVAVGAVEALKNYGVNIGTAAIKKGLYNTAWPGRCEVVSKRPLVILDGAQNAASVRALKEAIKENFSAEGGSASGGKYKRLILVLGACCDKDIKGICKELFSIADEIILTKANSPRAAEPASIKYQVSGIRCQDKIYITKNVKEAIGKAREIVARGDLILVTGSLFVVGEARSAMQNLKCKM